MRHLTLTAMLLTACATPAGTIRSSSTASQASTNAVEAVVRGDYAAALADTDRGLSRDHGNSWLLYNRGIALAGLGRTDESLQTLRAAERSFADAHDRGLAVYRRGLVLEGAGRCAEAATEYSRYAALVRANEPQLAGDAMAQPTFCVAPTAQQEAERDEAARLRLAASDTTVRKAEELSTAAGRALSVGDYAAALARADEGLALIPADPWLLYDKGAALADLERPDEALPLLHQAEQEFATTDVHGRSVASYRRALALEAAGRCNEERDELQHYASLVRPTQPHAAQQALTHLKYCRIATSGRTRF
jgi:tetratricopeptide (TPR) repeat protein